MSDTIQTLRQFRGSLGRYAEFATRGAATLAVGIEYAQHPVGDGFLIVRFSARGLTQSLTRFTQRGHGQFLAEPVNPAHNEVLEGVRLNKVALKIYSPGPSLPWLVVNHSPELWAGVANWLQAQAEAEGFTVAVADLAAFVQERVLGEVTSTDNPPVLSLDFADLEPAKAFVPPVTPVEDDEDEDEDEDGDDPEWLN